MGDILKIKRLPQYMKQPLSVVHTNKNMNRNILKISYRIHSGVSTRTYFETVPSAATTPL